MLLRDLVYEVKNSITTNKARSSLTILGIVIGIASVIAMISIGQGAQKSIEENIQAIGANLLMIRPGSSFGPGAHVSGGQGTAKTLTLDDADAIKKEIGSVASVAPESSERYQVTAKGTNTNTSITGVTSEYAGARNVQIENGDFFSEQHIKSRSKVAVVGPETASDLFGEDTEAVGQKIRIKGIDFTVIGTTVAKGGTGFGSSDDVIYIPVTTLQQFLSGSDSLSLINVTVSEQSLMDKADKDITELLLERHSIADSSEADFRIVNQADIVSTASSVTETFTILLAAVAGISLVVGGIGIMNMMLTSVTERTKEIGLRKAIGAKKADISMQFLVEAVSLTFIGGAVGVALGLTISALVEKYAGLATQVTMSSVLLAFGVSALIGIVFGYYPARRAAKFNPIDALRYE
ncbi:MAG TPA: multidrug ABC transporter substrate-binding protein [Candidatus Moranbacteria bacterium]|nr:multidrug ABC transporter substrate-binding protein [Candidatus Moranbacteria bacterium]